MVPSKGDVFTKHMEFHRTQDILNLKLKNKLRKNSSTLKAFIFLVKVNLCSALCTLTMSEYDPERQSVIRLQTKNLPLDVYTTGSTSIRGVQGSILWSRKIYPGESVVTQD